MTGDKMNCILCGSPSQILDSTSRDSLCNAWMLKFNINVAKEIPSEIRLINKWLCPNCRLVFYDPRLAGSDVLYEQLQSFAFYYLEDKWEHRAALKFIKPAHAVLEIGCGNGVFLSLLSMTHKITGVGIELNSKALAEAKSRGLNVVKCDLSAFVSQHSCVFDVVCHFQVLEHVPNPRQFIGDCCALLRPGGLLILGVPNGDGFLKLMDNNLLNMPPHHISVFSRKTLQYVADLFSLDMVEIRNEPLSDLHLNWFCNAFIDRIPKVKYITWPCVAILRRWLPSMLSVTVKNRCLLGHSIFVVFRKQICR